MTSSVALARQLESSETDPLTGAPTLAAGLTDLEHQLARCQSTGRVGFAELAPDETVTELIARAEGELAASRRGTEDLP